MDIRTLQRTGGSSYSLILPKTWISKHALEHKGAVEIHALSTGQLVLVPKKPAKIISATLRIDILSDNQVVREILGKYISGVDEITISSSPITYGQRNLIRNISYKLIGFEVFEESSDWILLKNVSSSNIMAAEYIKKMVRIIRSMVTDMIRTIDNGDRKLALDIIQRDVEVDRIHLTILRQFNILLKKVVPEVQYEINPIDLHYYELAGIRLERLADHVVRIALTVSKLADKEKVILNKFEHADLIKINKYIDALPDIIFEHKRRTAHEILDINGSRDKNEFINNAINSKHPTNILIQDSLERIRSYVCNIAEETINYYDAESGK